MEHNLHMDSGGGSYAYAIINATLFMVGIGCNIVVNSIDLSFWYDCLFKAMSLLSVSLIVIINWSKAWAVITGKNKKEKKNGEQ